MSYIKHISESLDNSIKEFNDIIRDAKYPQRKNMVNNITTSNQPEVDNLKYITKFMLLNSAVDLLPLFQRCRKRMLKEITESWAMYEALKKLDTHYGKTFVKPRIIVVGDGVNARTGALLAYLTKYKVWSIDPQFDDKPVGDVLVDRLQTFKCRVEDMAPRTFQEPIVIIMLHSHAYAPTVLKTFNSEKGRDLIICPCCNRGTGLDQQSDIRYRDEYMLSEENFVRIFCGI